MIQKFLRLLTDALAEAQLPQVAREVRKRRLTYLSVAKLASLHNAVRMAKDANVPGDFVEYGVALGGSAVYLASELDGARHFRGYDVFGMIPAPGKKDDAKSKERYEIIRSGQSKGIGDAPYYGYRTDLYEAVCSAFKTFNDPVDGHRISLHRGLFEDTVKFSESDRIALAHIDCDWYDPVTLCLERTANVLSPRGIIILDDYNDYSGCRNATDQFLNSHRDFRILRSTPHAVIRKAG